MTDCTMNKVVLLLGVILVLAVAAHSASDEKQEFVPKSLPCASVVVLKGTGVICGEVHLEYTTVYSKQGDYLISVCNSTKEGINEMSCTLLRSDLKDPDNPTVYGKRFLASFSRVESCSSTSYTKEDYTDRFAEDLMFLGVNQTCDKVEDSSLSGKDCHVCIFGSNKDSSNEPESHYKLYFDDENTVLLVEVLIYTDNPCSESQSSSPMSTSSGSTIHSYLNTKYTYSYSYEFSQTYPPLSTFVVPESITSKCQEEAYTAPTKELCEPPSSKSGESSTSAGSTIAIKGNYSVLFASFLFALVVLL